MTLKRCKGEASRKATRTPRRGKKYQTRRQKGSANFRNIRALMAYESSEGYRDEILPGNSVTVNDRIQEFLNIQTPLDKEIIVWRGQSNNPEYNDNDNNNNNNYNNNNNNYTGINPTGIMDINPRSWFSTSLHKKVAQYFGLEDDRYYYVFKIYVQPGVKVVHLHNEYSKYGLSISKNEHNNTIILKNGNPIKFKNISPAAGSYTKYDEILVNGGGTFWQDAEKTIPGFRETVQTVPKLIKGTKRKYGDVRMKVIETYYFP